MVYGTIAAIMDRPAGFRYSYSNQVFKIIEFQAVWTISGLSMSAPEMTGPIDLAPVAAWLSQSLPISYFANLVKYPFILHRIKHLFTAPRAITTALQVSRPDLYWIVAGAWRQMIGVQSASFSAIEKATSVLVDATWPVAGGTLAYRHIFAAMKAAQIVAVRTSPKSGIADIQIDGTGAVSVAERDKFILACVLVWGKEFNWYARLPVCAPKPIQEFIAFLK